LSTRARRLGSALLAALLAATALAEGLVVGLSIDVLNWNPGRTRSAVDSALLDNVFERLVDFDPNGDPIPALATSWAWLEPERWRFELRPGVRFSNGEPFDARTVRRNLELQRQDPRSGARTWLQAIRGVDVVDDLTVDILTDGPAAELPHALAWAGRMAPLAYGFDGDAFSAALLEAPVGTGPYRLVAWERGRSLRLEANPDWWGPAPAVTSVDVRVIPDPAARVAALRAGTVDLIDRPDLGDLDALRAAPTLRVAQLPDQRLVYLLMDSFRAVGGPIPDGSPGLPVGAPNPLRDVRVRRALDLALDRVALAAEVHRGTVTPVGQPALPGSLAFDPAVGPRRGDPAAARALLADAGYPDGFALTVTALVGTIDRAEETLRFVVDAWAAVGVAAELEVPPFEEAARRYSRLDVTVGMASWGGLTAPLMAWRGMFGADVAAGTFGSQNVGRYVGDEINALLTRLRNEPAGRVDRYREVVAAFGADVPTLPLYVTQTLWAMDAQWALEPHGIGVLGFRDVVRAAP
jgi:peptide/nickel transport system substrate-binding protein